jgi:flagellar protein FliO/FliZ
LASSPGRDITGLKSSKAASAMILFGICLVLLCTLLPCRVDASVGLADSAANEAGGMAPDSSGLTAAAADSMVQRISRADSGRALLPLDIQYQEPVNAFSVWNISMVLVVIGLLVLFLHLLRKYLYRPLGAGVPSGQFHVIRQYHLGPKKSVTLVRFADRLLLLGVTDSSITTLAEIDDPDEVGRILNDAAGANGEQGGGFKDIYQNLLSRGKKNS